MQPGQLAQQQKQVLDATRALQQSQQANNAASPRSSRPRPIRRWPFSPN